MPATTIDILQVQGRATEQQTLYMVEMAPRLIIKQFAPYHDRIRDDSLLVNLDELQPPGFLTSPAAFVVHVTLPSNDELVLKGVDTLIGVARAVADGIPGRPKCYIDWNYVGGGFLANLTGEVVTFW